MTQTIFFKNPMTLLCFFWYPQTTSWISDNFVSTTQQILISVVHDIRAVKEQKQDNWNFNKWQKAVGCRLYKTKQTTNRGITSTAVGPKSSVLLCFRAYRSRMSVVYFEVHLRNDSTSFWTELAALFMNIPSLVSFVAMIIIGWMAWHGVCQLIPPSHYPN